MNEPALRYRVSTHKYSFSTNKNKTVLSEKVKELRAKNLDPEITFKVLEQSKSYKPESKHCQLCVAKKFYIIYGTQKNKLNRKSEIISKCKHKNKYKLATNG